MRSSQPNTDDSEHATGILLLPRNPVPIIPVSGGCPVIYLDSAATSWPKPPEVAEAMAHFLNHVGANPGRSGHRLSAEAGRIVNEARELVAELFRVPDPLRVTFAANATEALNLALQGYLRPGDHVITSSMEHNAVMRPLRALAAGAYGGAVELTVVPCSSEGFLTPADLETVIQPNTVMIVLNHGSNVCGSILPVRQVGAIARRRGILLLVDAAQTAGAYPIDMHADNIDLLAFTGHKSLVGPMGTGGLIIGERVRLTQLKPLKYGGTGSNSEWEEQPAFLPDKYESGTVNAVGLAGLAAGIRSVMGQGVDAVRQHEIGLTQRLINGLQEIPRVTVYGGRNATRQTATVSFTIAGLDPSEVGLRLDHEYDIMCRVGLHCAPAAHRTLGTFPTGTVRFGLSALSTTDQIDAALRAVREIAQSARKAMPG
jgi:cysteine desulfurase/selenocysteine lyase